MQWPLRPSWFAGTHGSRWLRTATLHALHTCTLHASMLRAHNPVQPSTGVASEKNRVAQPTPSASLGCPLLSAACCSVATARFPPLHRAVTASILPLSMAAHCCRRIARLLIAWPPHTPLRGPPSSVFPPRSPLPLRLAALRLFASVFASQPSQPSQPSACSSRSSLYSQPHVSASPPRSPPPLRLAALRRLRLLAPPCLEQPSVLRLAEP